MAATVTLARELEVGGQYIRVLNVSGLTKDTPEDIAHGGPTDTSPFWYVARVKTSPTDDCALSVGLKPAADLDNLTLEVNPSRTAADAAGATAGAVIEILCMWPTGKDSPQTAAASGISDALSSAY